MKINTIAKDFPFDKDKDKEIIFDDVTFNHNMVDGKGLSVSFIITDKNGKITGFPLSCCLREIDAHKAMSLDYDIHKKYVFLDNEKLVLANISSLQCLIVVTSSLPNWEAELKFHFA